MGLFDYSAGAALNIVTKNEIIEHTISLEGGYVNNPNDSGGATNFGITESVARDNDYFDEMSEMPKAVAFEIYDREYWNKIHGDEVIKHSELIANEMMDTAVNMGCSRAVKFLQRSLNVLVEDVELDVDGLMGGQSLSALTQYMNHRNDDVTLCKALNCLQGAYDIELAERREKDKDFVYGWLRNRVWIPRA